MKVGVQMSLHYPKYTKMDYEKMEEGKLDLLLNMDSVLMVPLREKSICY